MRNLLSVSGFVGLLLTAIVLSGACSSPVDESEVGSAGQAVITSVEPPSGEAAGPYGHILALNRSVLGFDALPSPDNEANGAYFTAQCGCVSLVSEGALISMNRYEHGDPKVTFPNVLEEGTHSYQAVYTPLVDASRCSGPWACPNPFAAVVKYISGPVKVTVQITAAPHKTYPNRCKSCPSWCDPSHPEHNKMTSKLPNRCYGAGKRRCGDAWSCTFVKESGTHLGCWSLDEGEPNPAGLYQIIRHIEGWNTCDPWSEAVGGSASWYADHLGNSVLCPSTVATDTSTLLCCYPGSGCL
jgi:hypothetical protein